MSSNYEQRLAPVELRVDLTIDRQIRGTAIVFNRLSEDLGGFREIIKPEAVDRTLSAMSDVRALWNHDTSEVLGRTKSGTLLLKKDKSGLSVRIDPPKWAEHRLETISRGDVTGMSFRFRTLTDNWRLQDGETIREIEDMEFDEVSVVTFPAYPQTDVSVAKRALRSFQQQMAGTSVAYRERLLRHLRA